MKVECITSKTDHGNTTGIALQTSLKLILVMTLMLASQLLNAQTFNVCQNFNNGSLSNWVGSGVTASIQQPGPTGLANDLYLEGRDLQGPSFMTNSVDYAGDWTTRIGSCFCFDFQAIYLAGAGPVFPKISIRNASGTIRATFKGSTAVDITDGWINVCAPIEYCSGGALPSNADGAWILNGSNTCADWATLLANVAEAVIIFDYTNSPSEVVGYDNICIDTCRSAFNNGTFCCDSINGQPSYNLIRNGTFEGGNYGFNTQYTYSSAGGPNTVSPGSYMIGNSLQADSVCSNWIANDHSGCNSWPNENMLFVNGKSQQNTGSVIWEQTITGLDSTATYKFCGQFKNLPTCCFDVLPEITINIVGGPLIPATIINVNPNDPCEWQEIFSTFTPNSSTIKIQIGLNESGNGDGNDLALDDLSLIELPKAPVPFTLQHQSNPQTITASYGTIGTGDDLLPDANCQYLWLVGEVLTLQPQILLDGSTLALGGSSFNTSWGLTTTFPGYTFQPNKLYLIQLSISDCDCYANNRNFQLTFLANSGFLKIGPREFAVSEIEEIISKFDLQIDQSHLELMKDSYFESGKAALPGKVESDPFDVQVFPNPTKGMATIVPSVSDQYDVELVDLQGKTIWQWDMSNRLEINVNTYSKGIYFLKVRSRRHMVTKKLIID